METLGGMWGVRIMAVLSSKGLHVQNPACRWFSWGNQGFSTMSFFPGLSGVIILVLLGVIGCYQVFLFNSTSVWGAIWSHRHMCLLFLQPEMVAVGSNSCFFWKGIASMRSHIEPFCHLWSGWESLVLHQYQENTMKIPYEQSINRWVTKIISSKSNCWPGVILCHWVFPQKFMSSNTNLS